MTGCTILLGERDGPPVPTQVERVVKEERCHVPAEGSVPVGFREPERLVVVALCEAWASES